MLKKILLLTAIIAFTNSYAKSQLFKNNWLIGGDVKFSSFSTESTLGNSKSEGMEKNFDLTANVGRFFADKFALGVKPTFSSSNYDNIVTKSYLLGAFARYYFLNVDKDVNIVLDGAYQTGRYTVSFEPSGGSKGTKSQFGIAGGPAFFFNSDVAGEILIGYFDSRMGIQKLRGLQISVGLQIHFDN